MGLNLLNNKIYEKTFSYTKPNKKRENRYERR